MFRGLTGVLRFNVSAIADSGDGDTGDGTSSSVVSIQLSNGGNGIVRAGTNGAGERGDRGTSGRGFRRLVFRIWLLFFLGDFVVVGVFVVGTTASDICSDVGTGLRLITVAGDLVFGWASLTTLDAADEKGNVVEKNWAGAFVFGGVLLTGLGADGTDGKVDGAETAALVCVLCGFGGASLTGVDADKGNAHERGDGVVVTGTGGIGFVGASLTAVDAEDKADPDESLDPVDNVRESVEVVETDLEGACLNALVGIFMLS
jgi:hypothetical protein